MKIDALCLSLDKEDFSHVRKKRKEERKKGMRRKKKKE
jgi:hypothetical protein